MNKEQVFLPEVGWTYFDHGYFNRTNFDNCKTIRWSYQKQTGKLKTIFFSGANPNEPCILPFRYFGAIHDKCKTTYLDASGIIDSEV